jgi:HEAT repeat protein
VTPGVGATGLGADDGLARSRAVVAERLVLPFLREVLSREGRKRDDVVASALLALGRVAQDATAVPLIVGYLQDRKAPHIVRESAALAAGLLRRTERDLQLDGGTLDRLRDRLLAVFDDATASDRVRSLAMISIGLLGDQPFGSAESRDGVLVTHALWTRLQPDHSGAELPVALLTALGMQPVAGVPEEVRESLRSLVHGRRIRGRGWSDVERAHALSALARLGGSEADGLLLRVVHRSAEDVLVRRAAWIALSSRAEALSAEDRRGAIRAVLALVAKHRDQFTAGLSHVTLGRLVGVEARDPQPAWETVTPAYDLLRREAREGSSPTRGFSAIALGLACRDVPRESLEAAVVRGEAEKCLSRELASSGDPAVRGAFAVALGLMGSESGVGVLLATLKDDGLLDEVRGHAAVALGQIGRRSPEVLKTLRAALAERSTEDLKREAALGLSLLRAPDAAADLVASMKSARTEHLLAQLAVAFGRLADLSAVPPLLEVARDASRSELAQALAVVSLGLIVDPESRPSLHHLSTDANYPARTEALHEALSIL